jgi:diguanylate cyclase (GGDEF)-like protein
LRAGANGVIYQLDDGSPVAEHPVGGRLRRECSVRERRDASGPTILLVKARCWRSDTSGMAFTATAHKPKRWAREHLPVRVAIGMWITQALIGPLYLALPGVSQRHATTVFVCSAFALSWAVMNALLPSDPRLTFLYNAGGVLALADVSALVAATGGASSPLRGSQLFFVVFAAWFLPRGTGVRMLAGAVAVTLLPLFYDSHALAGAPLGWTIMLVLTFVVAGVTIVAARAKLESLRDRARAEAFRDPLTGVVNRRALERYFRPTSSERRESDSVGVVLIDLDHFKQVNTRHGHAGGDRALTLVAHALCEVVRDGDLVARIGGDEFVIIAAGVDARTLVTIGQRAVQSIAAAGENAELDGVALGASAGAALCPENGHTLEQLLIAADAALSAAKAEGKGRMRVAA